MSRLKNILLEYNQDIDTLEELEQILYSLRNLGWENFLDEIDKKLGASHVV